MIKLSLWLAETVGNFYNYTYQGLLMFYTNSYIMSYFDFENSFSNITKKLILKTYSLTLDLFFVYGQNQLKNGNFCRKIKGK